MTSPLEQVKAVRLLHPLALIFHHLRGPALCNVRAALGAAGEAHALPAAARAQRPEPAGAASRAPSPASLGLSTCSAGMELSLGLLLLWALAPPEAHGKEGKRGTRRRSLCPQGWAGARRERDVAPGTPQRDWGVREGQPAVGGFTAWQIPSEPRGLGEGAQVCASPPSSPPNTAQMPRHIQRSKRILPLFPSNAGLADNKFKHKLRKFLPSSGNTPAVSSRSPLKELTLVSKQTVILSESFTYPAHRRWSCVLKFPLPLL